MKQAAAQLPRTGYQGIARRFAALTDASYDGVLIYDAGVILNATPGAAALFGRVPRQLHRRPIDRLVATESRSALHHLQHAAGCSIPALALRHGGEVPIELSVKATVTLRGRRVCVVALRDTTADEAKFHRTDRELGAVNR